jgi:DNA-binding NtrC family response regulator
VNATNTIFVIEDQELVLSVLEEGLIEAGFGVEAVSTAEAAILKLDAEGRNFCGLITDIDLGGQLTGWDVAKHAREINPQLPVIYMTGASASEWASKGVPNSQLLQKPFAIAQVTTSISQMMNAVQNTAVPRDAA